MKYIPIKTEFVKNQYNHLQIKRVGDLAIYKRWKHSINHFEVILITRHEGYEMGGVAIEPAELYPSSSQWGTHGFTCPTIELAEKKLEDLLKLHPQGNEKIDYTDVIIKEKVKRNRAEGAGKKRQEVTISIPNGKFTVKDFAKECNVDLSLGYCRLKELIRDGKVNLVESKSLGKGKPTNFYKIHS